MLASLGGRLDFRECGPCGGACCKMPWAVFATHADLSRLVRWLRSAPEASSVAEALAKRRGKRREALDAGDIATLEPLPDWERAAYGEGNLLYPRVEDSKGRVPQVRKHEGKCQFLLDDGRCGVHPAKPLLCRLFPFYYQAAPAAFDSAPRPSPFRFVRTVDRGWAGNCPIAPERIEEVARPAEDALQELFSRFETDIAEHGARREEISAAWPALPA
jgi:Fe-S-cluster containining protein